MNAEPERVGIPDVDGGASGAARAVVSSQPDAIVAERRSMPPIEMTFLRSIAPHDRIYLTRDSRGEKRPSGQQPVVTTL